jgi:hypothetical protein
LLGTQGWVGCGHDTIWRTGEVGHRRALYYKSGYGLHGAFLAVGGIVKMESIYCGTWLRSSYTLIFLPS